ncbi:hypothetical protein U9M48_020373 [Paspalum notatum var. saurae]|uniref:CCHC-type domain-containing protein n=1 Tax=Paspalum notatum var. saurae TaxID=547442 RepID=A0AAQ3TFD1_PASNO
MKIKLQARTLWRIIDPGVVVSELEDRMALDAICSAVPQETLAVKPTAKQAWESLRIMRIGDDRLRKTSAQRVRRQYEELALRDGEGIEDFALRLTNIVSHDTRRPGASDQGRRKVPSHRSWQLQATCCFHGDLARHFYPVHQGGHWVPPGDNPEPPPKQEAGKLYLTEEQWLERMPPARNPDKCRYCGKIGHWAKDCRSKKRDEQA